MAHRSLILAFLASLFGITVETVDGPHGTVRVIDADTFDVGGDRVRLHGVDAPESHQSCTDADGSSWPCGEWAIEEARNRWEGRSATCTQLDTDRYGRAVSRCEVAGRDVGATLVSEGIALAYLEYSYDYVPQEAAAQAAHRGLWRGTFQRPEDYRRDPGGTLTEVETVSTDSGCLIKGNISGSGRIYHVPGSRSYDRTTVDEGEGERWFCTEDEARAAGWRAPRN